jgi:cytochrome oxidase Cu insertion factor (SCO1/SenC/PrrC family)
MSSRTVALLFSLILLLPGCLGSGEGGVELLGIEYKDPREAPDFTLINQDGESVSLDDYDGKVVVVAFIYTSCPDICLIISANLHYVHQNLGDYGYDVEILSVTIDPARDTVAHLSEWTQAMGYEWNHLTNERGSVMQAVWDDWNVLVDSEHIANSLPPEDAHNRFAVLFPDNSTLQIDYPYEQLPAAAKADEFARLAFERDNTTIDIGAGSSADGTNPTKPGPRSNRVSLRFR